MLFHPNLLTPKAAVRWADILCLASPPRPLTPLNISPLDTGVIASDQTVPLLTSSEDYPPLSMAEKGKGIDCCSITGPIQPSIRQKKKSVRSKLVWQGNGIEKELTGLIYVTCL